MAVQVIGCEVIPQLIAKLMSEAKVVAPHRREGDNQWVFAEVQDPGEVCLDYTSTILPPKKYAFPPKETLVRYEVGDRPKMEAVIAAEPLVIFGAHPCDIYGLTALDLAFSDQNVDPNYMAKRAQMRIVGVDCEPDEWCFCGSMGTASVAEGYDLFLTPIGDSYVAEAATAAGEEMLAGLPTREATAAELAAVKERMTRKASQERHLNCEMPSLPMRFAGFTESPVWEQWAKKCYSCGTCNLTCPTCFCFDVLDQMDLSLQTGEREREWDGCTLAEFAKVGSGENFREGREARLKHRFYRKYSYLFTKYGRPYCCGCGRCVRQCLVNIDPVGVINDLVAHGGKEA
jgi:ferredoxin